MASMTMTASSLLNGSASTITKPPTTSTPCQGLVVAKAPRASLEGQRTTVQAREESSGGRRELVVAAVAGAAWSIVKVAVAEEPKPGTPEAKKKYGPVCVTMPTARICHK
ncbi:photosystem II 5 kDa protein, chloroplastic-like [Ziziphus jujuba]|uniref:Photosystem II 5 kDa protein, chloroplastic-like n=1 Tax=Ziziphus jujuba TaxID=326968 RepID=A0ABM3IBT4_ZIZJJ|nr:photosystem II 5 kDa protein, chloroplastic-like [Ziziphus jujuba]